MTILLGGPGGPAFTFRPPDLRGFTSRVLNLFGLQRIPSVGPPARKIPRTGPVAAEHRRQVRAAYRRAADRGPGWRPSRRGKKKCFRCGLSRPRTEFTVDRHTKDGLRASCLLCVRGSERGGAGLCVRCGQVPPEGNHHSCRPCLDAHARRQRLRRQRLLEPGKGSRIDRGLCPRCGERPPEEGKTGCRPCLDAHNREAKERYRRRRAAGWSPNLDVQQKTRREAIAQGICPRHVSRPVPLVSGRTRCQECLEKGRVRKRARPETPETPLLSASNGSVPRGNRPKPTSPTQLRRRRIRRSR